MKNLAIIPARSGSKGLVNKNIKSLKGKPLMAYSIEAAKNSGCFDEIMVSTDSEEYACIAKKSGANVPFLRSEQTSSDTASSIDMIKEVLHNYNEIGKKFDTICLLQPTSPLRTATDICNAYDLFEAKNAGSVVSVVEEEHSSLWSNEIPEDLCMGAFIRPEVKGVPRQLLPKFYRLNGAIYIMAISDNCQLADLYDDNCFAYKMSNEKSVDIDTELDFLIAEKIMEYYEK